MTAVKVVQWEVLLRHFSLCLATLALGAVFGSGGSGQFHEESSYTGDSGTFADGGGDEGGGGDYDFVTAITQ